MGHFLPLSEKINIICITSGEVGEPGMGKLGNLGKRRIPHPRPATEPRSTRAMPDSERVATPCRYLASPRPQVFETWTYWESVVWCFRGTFFDSFLVFEQLGVEFGLDCYWSTSAGKAFNVTSRDRELVFWLASVRCSVRVPLST